MSSRAISVEIGYSLTKVCEVDYKGKNRKIHKSFTVPNGEEIINDGALTVTPAYVEAFRRALAINRVKAKQMIFTITSSKIANREVTIPYVKENRIADVVKANAADYFPMDISKYQLVHRIIGTVGEEKNAQQYKLVVVAVPDALLAGYYDLAKALKLEVLTIDYAANSIYQLAKENCTEGIHAVVKIDERASVVMVLDQSGLLFTRNVAYGIEEALFAVMETLCWGEVKTLDDAVRVLLRNECIGMEDPREEAERADGEAAAPRVKTAKTKALADVRAALMPMVGGIARVLDFYASRNAGKAIDNILITGIGADFQGMAKLLSQEVNMPVEVFKGPATWNIGRYFKNETFGEYMACVGAPVAPVGFKREQEKKGRVKAQGSAKGLGKVNGPLLAYTTLGLGLAAAAALTAIPTVKHSALKKTNVDLQAQAESLRDIEPIYNQYMAARAMHGTVRAMYAATENRNEGLVALLEELEQKLPATVNVLSLSSDTAQVVINMTVATKEDAAMAIEQLRTFEALQPASVTVSGLTQEEDEEGGVTRVNLTVTAAYRELLEEQTEDGGA